ncbi:MAG: transcriptional regulator [Armatimonadota bacterium]|nr:transcriptional regulator [Armatimonadota bacterium]
MNIKPIRSDSDYDAALEEIERLFASEPGTADADRLEVLVVLAQDYQRTHHPIGSPDMQSAIEFELDRRGFTRETADARQGVTAVNGIEIVGSVNTGRVMEATRRSRTRL